MVSSSNLSWLQAILHSRPPKLINSLSESLGWFIFACKINFCLQTKFLSLTLQNVSPASLSHRKSCYSSSSMNPMKSPHSTFCHVLSSLYLWTPLSFWRCFFLLNCFPMSYTTPFLSVWKTHEYLFKLSSYVTTCVSILTSRGIFFFSGLSCYTLCIFIL